MWIEFEADDGQLAFAKLAWVSPLRGTYLFTNRQGQKALSMTAEELAERFRTDRARLVEAEPLIDRALRQHDGVDRREVRRAGRAERIRATAATRLLRRHRATAIRIGALIIGDEILSGKRAGQAPRARDRDARARAGSGSPGRATRATIATALTAVLRESFARGDIVFSFGGIGATPDDHTRQAAAAALGVPLVRHPEARGRDRGAVRRRRLSASRADGRVPGRQRDHSESGQPRRVVLDPRPSLLPRLSADGVADARLGARDALSGASPRRRRASARSSSTTPARASCCR